MNRMNGSWGNCTQRLSVTSDNWKGRKYGCQGTVCSVSRGRDRAVLHVQETPPPHCKEDACTQDVACLQKLLFPRWSLRELTWLFIFAEQVSNVLGEGKSVCHYRFQHGFVVAIGIPLGFWVETTDNILLASLHIILVIKCLANILLIIENYE